MPIRVRSYSKINLGLAIGPPRADGFHSLTTLYQTLALYDQLTIVARPAATTRIKLRCNDYRVPLDARNTVWKMIARALSVLNRTAEVTVHIQKNLPVQGGLGAGSANAAAALIGLEGALSLSIPKRTRLEIAAQVGSDVPLFLIGGAVMGSNRGESVSPTPAVTLNGEPEIPCVIAMPGIGVSTPQAFRDWDARSMKSQDMYELHDPIVYDTIGKLSCTYASVFGHESEAEDAQFGASGIFPEPSLGRGLKTPEKQQGLLDEQLHPRLALEDRSGIKIDLADNSLLALVRTGIENDFETVVFPQYPFLREIKRHLMGPSDEESSAIYAALSGSGSALFGLYRTKAYAEDAQQRLQQHGVTALVTSTLPRPRYWRDMFAG